MSRPAHRPARIQRLLRALVARLRRAPAATPPPRGGRSLRLGLWLLGPLVLASLGADCIASDLPIALSFRGDRYWMPAWTRPGALVSYDNTRLRKALSAKDWAWWPLCEYGPEQQPQIDEPPPAAPSTRHWLGTDDRGRDVFARLVHGGRVSLGVGCLAVLLYLFIGTALGLFAGYLGGATDWVVSRLVEIVLTLPTFVVVVTVLALLGGGSLSAMVLVIGLTGWAALARLVRAEVHRLRSRDFIAAAKLCGASPARIIFVHLLPNALPYVLVSATFGVGNAVMMESALSFLGFGVPPPVASWGELLGQAYQHPGAWWLLTMPGLAILATVLGINLLGEGLSRRIDPRLGR